jgi:hypothetical protein
LLSSPEVWEGRWQPMPNWEREKECDPASDPDHPHMDDEGAYPEVGAAPIQVLNAVDPSRLKGRLFW